METTLNKNSIDLGVKLGTLLFIITAIIYVVDLNYFSNFILMLAVYRIPVMGKRSMFIDNMFIHQNYLIFFTHIYICLSEKLHVHSMIYRYIHICISV